MSFFEIYLPVAEVKADVLVLIAVGLLTGIIGGLFGLGGGLIVVPYLLMSGVPVPVAVATATNQMTAGTVCSFITYARHNLVDYKLAFIMLIGSIAGSFIGMDMFNRLSANGMADTVVPVVLLAVLFITTITTANDAIKILFKRHSIHKNKPCRFLDNLPLQTRFKSCDHMHSMLLPIFIGMIGGMLIAIVGIGGGFVMVPAMLFLLQCKVQFVSGTTIFQIIFTSILSTLLHSMTHRHIDLILVFILILGTVFGSQIGSRVGRKIRPERYRLLLALIIFFISVKFAYEIFFSPDNAIQIIMQ